MALFRGRLVQRVRRFPEEYHDFGWKYGDLHHYYNGSFFTQISNIDDEQMETNTWDVVGHSVGQCTYLVIKGQDLYEGDILENDNGVKYIVVWMEQLAAFYLSIPNTQRGKEIISCAASKVANEPMLLFKEAVIGNIYENPELLKK